MFSTWSLGCDKSPLYTIYDESGLPAMDPILVWIFALCFGDVEVMRKRIIMDSGSPWQSLGGLSCEDLLNTEFLGWFTSELLLKSNAWKPCITVIRWYGHIGELRLLLPECWTTLKDKVLPSCHVVYLDGHCTLWRELTTTVVTGRLALVAYCRVICWWVFMMSSSSDNIYIKPHWESGSTAESFVIGGSWGNVYNQLHWASESPAESLVRGSSGNVYIKLHLASESMYQYANWLEFEIEPAG